jgi:hypothetical protein
MTAHVAAIPEEEHTLIEFRQRNLPGFATVNSALKEFEPKKAFAWHLSVLIRFDDIVQDRLPSDHEQQVLYSFEDRLDSLIKANGNALFLARVTHDAHREIIWRVRDPDAVDSALREILRLKDYRREFDYRMENDPAWDQAQWYMQDSGNI